jgi:hypothetical protein
MMCPVSYIEKRFVQAEWFDEGRLLAEDSHDLMRDGPIHLEARRQEDGLGAEAIRSSAGHS